MLKQPFEVPFSEVMAHPEVYVTAVFSSLVSEFLIMPKGEGFIDYETFEAGYEKLKQATSAFQRMTIVEILPVAINHPITIIVLRSILGFSPSEWAYVASQRSGVEITQGFARSLDRRVRMRPTEPLKEQGVTYERFKVLVGAACQLLSEGAPATDATKLHRLAKADTQNGITSLRSLSGLGVPYAMLLYERFLGRPFAGHRDSVSELVGENLESLIEDVLSRAGVSYRKTKRAERIPGFDQAPDFIIPSEFNPRAIIEAKVTEDDGTARDKVTRIQHLGELSLAGQPPDQPKFEVIACIAGRGFGVRREDMRKMLIATHGKVFTFKNINRLVDHTGIHAFRTK
jgi:hypothetical protein